MSQSHILKKELSVNYNDTLRGVKKMCSNFTEERDIPNFKGDWINLLKD
jgi:hypothetical protein